eukprot:gene10195-8107_t
MLPQMMYPNALQSRDGQKTFKDLGVTYSVGGMTGNTFDSHRLIHWVGETSGAAKQNALVEELFMNYFSQEKFINDRAVLVAAADKVGQPGAAEYLADPKNGKEEVPFFTIGGQAQLDGAQEVATFENTFTQVLAAQAKGLMPTARSGGQHMGVAQWKLWSTCGGIRATTFWKFAVGPPSSPPSGLTDVTSRQGHVQGAYETLA